MQIHQKTYFSKHTTVYSLKYTIKTPGDLYENLYPWKYWHVKVSTLSIMQFSAVPVFLNEPVWNKEVGGTTYDGWTNIDGNTLVKLIHNTSAWRNYYKLSLGTMTRIEKRKTWLKKLR
jgi:hypothetical protein